MQGRGKDGIKVFRRQERDVFKYYSQKMLHGDDI